MADAFDDEVEHTVSIQDLMKGTEQEMEADMILGGDEGDDCTYSEGYMKRQAIFSCLTCTPDGNAGVCTACSLACHDNHEIVELWTKRHFRCDCGNSKFGEVYCKLVPGKDPENSENSYNQNFKGSYCTCGKPYPDPDTEDQVDMIQCCICEDWFHEAHLGCKSIDEIPRAREGESAYEDFICQACAKKCSFLTLYPPAIWAITVQCDAPQNSGEEENVSGSSLTVGNGVASLDAPIGANATTDVAPELVSNGKVVLTEEKSETNMGSKDSSSKCILGVDPVVASVTTDAAPELKSNGKAVLSEEKPKTDVGSKDSSSKCILEVDPRKAHLENIKPMFLAKNWRKLLCKCAMCVEFYKEKGISFLIDSEDSIAEYEKMARQKRDEKLQSQEDAELNFLSELGHVQQIEILSGIADMKNELQSFLATVDTSKPVTTADVHRIFENLAKKRRRLQ